MTRTLLYDASNKPLVTAKTPADLDREHELLISAFGLLSGATARNREAIGKALLDAIVVTIGAEKLMARFPNLQIKAAPGVH